MGQFSIESIKYRLTQSHWHIFRHNGDLGTNGIALFTQRLHIGFQLGHLGCIGEKEWVSFNHRLIKVLGHHGAELGDIAKNLDAQTLFQVFFCDATGGHTHGCLTGRTAPATAIVALTILLMIGIICMRRSK